GNDSHSGDPGCRPVSIRRLGARSPWAVFITYCDGSTRARPGCRGTIRGTSADRIPVRCVLSVRQRVASVQLECLERPSSPLLIRGFGVRVPGGAPVLAWANAYCFAGPSGRLVAVLVAVGPPR